MPAQGRVDTLQLSPMDAFLRFYGSVYDRLSLRSIWGSCSVEIAGYWHICSLQNDECKRRVWGFSTGARHHSVFQNGSRTMQYLEESVERRCDWGKESV